MRNLELVYVRHNISGKAPRIHPSNISFYDLTILLNGKLEYTIDGEDITVESGDMIFIPAGSLRYRKESEEFADYISFNFTSESEYKLPLVLKNIARSEIVLLITAYDKIEKHAYHDTNEKSEYLCGCILSVLEGISEASQYNPLTRKIMEYIHSDVSRKVTLDDIGKLTFFSPIYCDTVFRKETGRSIIDYVLDRRIDEAKRLLLEGSMTLSQISETVGYKSKPQFYNTFVRIKGVTPRQYRLENKK
jgi:YesN/AraC family two-component response regulator